MPINIDNCLEPCKDGNPVYKVFVDCCCPVSCSLSNNGSELIQISQFDFTINGDFTVTNILINGNPIPDPFRLDPFESVTLEYNICGGFDTDSGSIILNIDDSINGLTQFEYCIESIVASSAIDSNTVNFGNVAIGQTATKYVQISDLVFCCNDYYQSGLGAPFANGSGITICSGDGDQVLELTFSPTAVGSFNDTMIVSVNECTAVNVPVLGNGIEFVPGGNPVDGGKKKIAQSLDPAACTAKGNFIRCQPFNATIQKSIQSISRQMPKGGSGRGTKFSK